MSEFDFSKIEQHTNERINKGILPGALIAVSIGGKPIYTFAGGYSNVERKTPLKFDAMFRLASMTKPITAVACLLAEDMGLLKVTDNISKYISEFSHMYVGAVENGKVVKTKEADKQITIEDILTHSSGIGTGKVGEMQYKLYGHKDGQSLKDTVLGYAKSYLAFSPATNQLYSPSQALDVVARIVEIVSDMPYDQFLKKYVFTPLNMENTTYTLNSEQYNRLPPLYRLSDDVTNINEVEDIGNRGFMNFPIGYTGGAAGLFSCLNDYVNFANMLALGGMFNGKRVLSENAVRKMRTPHFEIGFGGLNTFFNWGYAVRVVMEQKSGVQELTPESFGWSGAYNTHFWVDPKLKLSGVYMSNMDNAGGAGAITAFEFECDTMRAISCAKN